MLSRPRDQASRLRWCARACLPRRALSSTNRAHNNPAAKLSAAVRASQEASLAANRRPRRPRPARVSPKRSTSAP